MVLQRELYIADWSWIYQFPLSETKGKTKFSQWNNTFRYPKQHLLPETTKLIPVEKGLVHLTQGVPEYMFEI